MAKATQSVTSLDISPEQDRNSRMIRYSIAMATRFLCVILAVVVPYSFMTWVFWAGAIFLPYFAVVIANAQGSSAKSRKQSNVVAPTLTISADAFSFQDSKPAADAKPAADEKP